jgi:hypothetical protein
VALFARRSSFKSRLPGGAPALVEEEHRCLRVVAWCVAEKRTFLRQRVESRLVAIDYARAKYDTALKLVNRLLRELKKLDDKQLLVETHLSESRIHAALRNVPKAKAALTVRRRGAFSKGRRRPAKRVTNRLRAQTPTPSTSRRGCRRTWTR